METAWKCGEATGWQNAQHVRILLTMDGQRTGWGEQLRGQVPQATRGGNWKQRHRPKHGYHSNAGGGG